MELAGGVKALDSIDVREGNDRVRELAIRQLELMDEIDVLKPRLIKSHKTALETIPVVKALVRDLSGIVDQQTEVVDAGPRPVVLRELLQLSKERIALSHELTLTTS